MNSMIEMILLVVVLSGVVSAKDIPEDLVCTDKTAMNRTIYRLIGCLKDKWQNPKPPTIDPKRCCYSHEIICASLKVRQKYCIVTKEYMDHIIDLYKTNVRHCAKVYNGTEPDEFCKSEPNTPVRDDVCDQYIPCSRYDSSQLLFNIILIIITLIAAVIIVSILGTIVYFLCFSKSNKAEKNGIKRVENGNNKVSQIPVAIHPTNKVEEQKHKEMHNKEMELKKVDQKEPKDSMNRENQKTTDLPLNGIKTYDSTPIVNKPQTEVKDKRESFEDYIPVPPDEGKPDNPFEGFPDSSIQ